jgi:hypothetical protein
MDINGTYFAPLYLYPEVNEQQSLIDEEVRTPNLNMESVKEIEQGLGLTFVPDHDFCHAELVSASQEILK